MSNNYQDWEDDEEDVIPSQQSESDLLKQLRKELKNKSKMLSEMEGQLSSIKTEQRHNVIKSVLESKGVSPKIAKFIPQDIEANPDVIDNWIAENADIFGLTSHRFHLDQERCQVHRLICLNLFQPSYKH